MRASIPFRPAAQGLERSRGAVCLVLALALATAGCGSKNSSTTSTSTVAPTGTISLLAGVPGAPGLVDGTALSSSRLNDPLAVTSDGNSNYLLANYFIADSGNNTIRWLSHNAQGWQLRTLAGMAGQAGSADGDQSHARFNAPSGIVYVPGSPATLYVADTGNNTIRKITFVLAPATLTSTATVSTYAGLAGTTGSADGQGSAARFNAPAGLAADSAGVLYVADTGNDLIREVDTTATSSTLAGAMTTEPNNTLVPTVGSADGQGAAASFNGPQGIAVTGSGGGAVVYVADSGNSTIRRIDAAGNVSTWAGSAGTIGSLDGSSASFYSPTGLALDSQGNLYVADTGNDLIRVVSSGQQVSTLAGTAGTPGGLDAQQGLQAEFDAPAGLTMVAGGSSNTLLLADSANDTVRQITVGSTGGTLVAQQVSTLVGSTGLAGSADGTGVAALLSLPQGMVIDSASNIVFVADYATNTIREITPDGFVYTLAGNGIAGYADGPGSEAEFNLPYGLAIDKSAGNMVLYVTDYGNDLIRRLTLTANAAVPSGWDVAVDTYAGSMAQKSSTTTGTVLVANPGSANGTGPAAQFNGPMGIIADTYVDASGATRTDVYVADSLNDTIRLIVPSTTPVPNGQGVEGTVSLYAGAPGDAGSTDSSLASSTFNLPAGLAVGPSGDQYFYVADYGNNTIRKIVLDGDKLAIPNTTQVLTVAGIAGTSGSVNGKASAATFFNPVALTFDDSRNLFISDSNNHTIRELSSAGVVSTVAGLTGKAGFLAGNLPGLLDGPVGIVFTRDSSNGRHLYVTSSTALANITLY